MLFQSRCIYLVILFLYFIAFNNKFVLYNVLTLYGMLCGTISKSPCRINRISNEASLTYSRKSQHLTQSISNSLPRLVHLFSLLKRHTIDSAVVLLTLFDRSSPLSWSLLALLHFFFAGASIGTRLVEAIVCLEALCRLEGNHHWL